MIPSLCYNGSSDVFHLLEILLDRALKLGERVDPETHCYERFGLMIPSLCHNGSSDVFRPLEFCWTEVWGSAQVHLETHRY